MSGNETQGLKKLPAVQTILASEALTYWRSRMPRHRIVSAIRLVLDVERDALLQGHRKAQNRQALESAVIGVLQQTSLPTPRPLINATGVIIHTNLGRVPLSPAAAERVKRVAENYNDLELDLGTGARGDRHRAIARRLKYLTGAEEALVVNNNAAAVLLALDTWARGCAVAVSRGELVEIGGAFRIPEVLEKSGATLMEVGTTNKTRLQDYEKAIADGSRLLLKVHPSNYRICGFTESVSTESLVSLGQAHGVPVLYDLGSGLLLDSDLPKWIDEPPLKDVVAAGVDIVTFSGDKLLGGPQAGVVMGSQDMLQPMANNPLTRALRPDKMTLAALDACLEMYQQEEGHLLPVWQMILQEAEEVKRRADRAFKAILRKGLGLEASVHPTEAEVGGGSLPLARLPSWGVYLRPKKQPVQELARAMRLQEPPCVGRIQQESLVLDFRTTGGDREEEIADILEKAWEQLEHSNQENRGSSSND